MAQAKQPAAELPQIMLTRAEIVSIVRQTALDALAAKEAKVREAFAKATQPDDGQDAKKQYTHAVRQRTRREFTSRPRIAALTRALRAAGVPFQVYIPTTINGDGTVSARLAISDVEADIRPAFLPRQHTALAKHKQQSAAYAAARKRFDADLRDIEAQRAKLREKDVMTAVVTRALAGQDSKLRAMLQKLGDEVARTLTTTAIG